MDLYCMLAGDGWGYKCSSSLRVMQKIGLFRKLREFVMEVLFTSLQKPECRSERCFIYIHQTRPKSVSMSMGGWITNMLFASMTIP